MIYIAYDPDTGAVDEIAFAEPDWIPEGKETLPVTEEQWNAASGKILKVVDGTFVWSDPPPTVADYDKAMEDHLLAERSARGYTTREPSDYKDSTVPRWAQDASDWIANSLSVRDIQYSTPQKEIKSQRMLSTGSLTVTPLCFTASKS